MCVCESTSRSFLAFAKDLESCHFSGGILPFTSSKSVCEFKFDICSLGIRLQQSRFLLE